MSRQLRRQLLRLPRSLSRRHSNAAALDGFAVEISLHRPKAEIYENSRGSHFFKDVEVIGIQALEKRVFMDDLFNAFHLP